LKRLVDALNQRRQHDATILDTAGHVLLPMAAWLKREHIHEYAGRIQITGRL